MATRNGHKRRGGHTTLIGLAATTYDICAELPEVSGISPGLIKNGKRVTGGTQRVKIGRMEGGFLILTVRLPRSVQEVRVITSDPQKTKLGLARALRNKHIPISFQK